MSRLIGACSFPNIPDDPQESIGLGYSERSEDAAVSVTSIDPVERRVAAAPAQTISPERAASFVASDMWLDYGTGLCQPDRFDRALAARVHEVSPRSIVAGL